MNKTAGSTAEVDVEHVDRLFLAVAQLTRRLRREAPTALSHGSIVALGTVSREGPLRLGDLAAAEGVRAPTMSRIVDGLVDEGLVERIPDPADGRACLVRATPAGEAELRGARSARSQILAVRVASLPPDLRAQLFDALPALEALSA
jgi:DNA-binding MarR family transcriptional regulator